MLTITVDKTRDSAILHCAGRIFRGPAVSELMQSVLAAGDRHDIVLDCSKVDAVDAGGLSALVELHHWSQGRGIRFRLVQPSRFMHEILALTRLDRILEITWQCEEVGIAEGAVTAPATPPEIAWFCEQFCS